MITGGAAAGGGRPPVIGISAYREQARWSVWDTDAMVLPARYAERVSQAGAVPVLLPPVPGTEHALDRLDGLVLSGGGDIDPARYGARRSPHCGAARPDRDEAELALFARARSIGLPVLGICRGLQVINVALGGTLHQHLPDLTGTDLHAPGQGRYGSHQVEVTAGTALARVLGPGRDGTVSVAVPTHHHQAVDVLGAGLTATAHAADGVIEAVEPLDPAGHPFLLAVQWHPEAGDDPSLFRALTAAAADRMLAAL
jgi:putative glutamine amidotransferase